MSRNRQLSAVRAARTRPPVSPPHTARDHAAREKSTTARGVDLQPAQCVVQDWRGPRRVKRGRLPPCIGDRTSNSASLPRRRRNCTWPGDDFKAASLANGRVCCRIAIFPGQLRKAIGAAKKTHSDRRSEIRSPLLGDHRLHEAKMAQIGQTPFAWPPALPKVPVRPQARRLRRKSEPSSTSFQNLCPIWFTKIPF